MSDIVTSILGSVGPLGVALLMLLETVFPPLPSEVIMPYAGYLAAQGRLSLPLVLGAGTLGSTAGALALYAVGRAVGRRRLRRFIEHRGHWFTISPADLARAERFFARHGFSALLAGRLVPGLRSVISLPAGICEMRLPRVLVATALGTAAWTTLLTLGGFFLGKAYGQIGRAVDLAVLVVCGLLLGVYVVRLWRQLAKRRRTRECGGPRSSGREPDLRQPEHRRENHVR